MMWRRPVLLPSNTPSRLFQPNPDHGCEPRRFLHQTIDDPELRSELAVAMVEQPLEFLGKAARTLGVLGGDRGEAVADLIAELMFSGYPEGIAMAAALAWLRVGGLPQPVEPGALPPWLACLDEVYLVEAFRRRDGIDRSKSSYLIDVRLSGNFAGTLHARIDHDLEGALVNAFVTDDRLDSVRGVFRAADRWRPARIDSSSDPRPFRRIKPSTAQRALAGALAFAAELDPPLDLVLPWPGNRALVEFLVNDPSRTLRS